MMVEFINKHSGKMLVHESRVKEYEAMGHTVASNFTNEEAKEAKKPVRKSVKKPKE